MYFSSPSFILLAIFLIPSVQLAQGTTCVCVRLAFSMLVPPQILRANDEIVGHPFEFLPFDDISRYSDWLRAGWTRGRSSSPDRVKNSNFSISSRLTLGSTQPPIHIIQTDSGIHPASYPYHADWLWDPPSLLSTSHNNYIIYWEYDWNWGMIQHSETMRTICLHTYHIYFLLNGETKTLEIINYATWCSSQCHNLLYIRAVRYNVEVLYGFDRLCGLVVRVLDYRCRGPGFDSRALQKKKLWSGTGCTQPREYNWGATW
jgi:hypothetical protein